MKKGKQKEDQVLLRLNFPPKKVADFSSDVLTLGFKSTSGIGWVLITPSENSVELGDKLR